jgi:hypothetical protein
VFAVPLVCVRPDFDRQSQQYADLFCDFKVPSANIMTLSKKSIDAQFTYRALAYLNPHYRATNAWSRYLGDTVTPSKTIDSLRIFVAIRSQHIDAPEDNG